MKISTILAACAVLVTATAADCLAQAADTTVSAVRPKPALPRLHQGTRVRVWTDAVLQARVLSTTPEFYEGTFLRWEGDRLTFELNEPVATVADVGIGHMTTENAVPVERIARLQRQHIGTTPTRLKLGLALGAVAGTLVALGADECGNDARCSAGQRAVGGAVTFGVVAAVTAIRRVWQDVALPGR